MKRRLAWPLGALCALLLGAATFAAWYGDRRDPFSCRDTASAELAHSDAESWPPLPTEWSHLAVVSAYGADYESVLLVLTDKVVQSETYTHRFLDVAPGGGFALVASSRSDTAYSQVLIDSAGTSVVVIGGGSAAFLDDHRLLVLGADRGCKPGNALEVDLHTGAIEPSEVRGLERAVSVVGDIDGDILLCELYEGDSGPECATPLTYPPRPSYVRLNRTTLQATAIQGNPPTPDLHLDLVGLPRGEVTSDVWCREASLRGC